VREGDIVGEEKLDVLGKDIGTAWEWVWKTSAETDRERALRMLGEGEREEAGCAIM